VKHAAMNNTPLIAVTETSLLTEGTS
jgi:hypothetical protein